LYSRFFPDIFLLTIKYSKTEFMLQFKLSFNNKNNKKNHIRRRNEEESPIEAI